MDTYNHLFRQHDKIKKQFVDETLLKRKKLQRDIFITKQLLKLFILTTFFLTIYIIIK